eukprot:5718227-Amphidinium_carterae.2
MAMEASGAWGASGEAFKRAVQDCSITHHMYTRPATLSLSKGDNVGRVPALPCLLVTPLCRSMRRSTVQNTANSLTQ